MVDTSTLSSALGATDLGTDIYATIGNYLGISATATMILFFIIAIWSLTWKGFALWKSSKKNHLIWFIVLLIVNSVGILEILYIFIFSKMSLKGKAKTRKK